MIEPGNILWSQANFAKVVWAWLNYEMLYGDGLTLRKVMWVWSNLEKYMWVWSNHEMCEPGLITMR